MQEWSMNMEKTRFSFGKNWKNYVHRLDDDRIKEAEKSLREWFGTDSLKGKTFLDIGSGSGLFSLAARNMGADVFSFDYDLNSVDCTQKVKNTFYPNDDRWIVERGDILDKEYLSKYKDCDIVYSWGVLHHTGNMYKAFDNVSRLVKADGGLLYIAIYNDQGFMSKIWRIIKKTYNHLFGPLKLLISVPFFVVLWTERSIVDLIRLKPFDRLINYSKKRGMSPWHDAVDWVGGYPFEYAKPEEVFKFFKERGFELEKIQTCGGGNACNHYLFSRRPEL